MESETITVVELFNDYLLDIDCAIDKTTVLLNILLDKYFYSTKEHVEKDNRLSSEFVRSYEEIQTLLQVLFNYVFEAKKEMERIMNIELRDIVASNSDLND